MFAQMFPCLPYETLAFVAKIFPTKFRNIGRSGPFCKGAHHDIYAGNYYVRGPHIYVGIYYAKGRMIIYAVHLIYA